MKVKTILLVEDDELDVISVRRSLKKLGIEHMLFTAVNGLEAMIMLTDKQERFLPDVILLDLNMPKMNGIEFLKFLRSEAGLDAIKVYIMTTSSEDVDRQITGELGIAGYIIKPLSNINSKKPDSMESFMQFHLRKILTEG